MKLDKSFQAALERGTHKGSWTRIVMPGSVEFFATRGPVKIKAAVDNCPIEGSFIPVGDGTHMLPIKSEIRKAIGKDVGDTVTIKLIERL